MRLLRRVLVSVLPTMAVLAGCGYLFAGLAGPLSTPDAASGERLTAELQWRLPVYFALWGGGILFMLEFLLTLWAKPKPKADTATKPTPEQEAQALLQQLLDEADRQREAEAQANPPTLDQTPPPLRGDTIPMPEIEILTTTTR